VLSEPFRGGAAKNSFGVWPPLTEMRSSRSYLSPLYNFMDVASAEHPVLPAQALSRHHGELIDRFHRDRGDLGAPVLRTFNISPCRASNPLQLRDSSLGIWIVQLR
jgi:hypothetical protein